MASEEVVENEQGFPGENEEVANEAEAGGGVQSESAPVEPKVEEGNKPWIVCRIDDIALKDSGRIIADQEGTECFKLQVEADQWIKENADEGSIYASMRKGKLVRAKVVRKLEEV